MTKKSKSFTSSSTAGSNVSYSNVYQVEFIDLKLEKAVNMLLKKISKLEDKLEQIEINCNCQ